MSLTYSIPLRISLFKIAERNMGRSVDRMGSLASKLLKQIEGAQGCRRRPHWSTYWLYRTGTD